MTDAGTGTPDADSGAPDADVWLGGDPTGTRCRDARGYSYELTRLELCDGYPRCADGRDEADEACEYGVGYHCHGTDLRIARRKVCDQVSDCPEGDDEPCFTTPPTCPAQEPVVEAWLGGHSVCEVLSVAKPGIDDIHYQVRCTSAGAIAPSSVCDGKRDCPDGEDESGCPTRCPEWECQPDGGLCSRSECDFICADGSTVPVRDICDGASDCPSGEDEGCVDRFACYGDTGSSIDFSQVCDGIEDCWDGRDESNCPHPPSDTYFICDDGEEILFPYFSNGCFKEPFPREPHCSDGSAAYLPCPAR
ncbi:MAG TPA: LDL receptor domain-containing protein [Polyangiaceae bacterium]|nr:LDL receptor domain-containing protein [Polyangiaceae bacterium]